MRNRWIGPLVAAAMWAYAAAVFGRLPARVPSHWNLAGEVDGWMDRMPGAFVAPLAATLILLLLHFISRVDPRAENVQRSRGDWTLLVNLLVLFFAVLQVATLGVALGWDVDVGRVLMAAMGLLFAGIGNYLPRIRSNWFVGIRTPWTLDNERVWRATHRVGGRMWVAAGIALALGALLPAPARGVVIGVALAVAVGVPLVYSYVAWRRDLAGRPL